jgi:putative ABC transport system ATP-binding protein
VFIYPTQGQVVVGGQAASSFSEKQLASLRLNNIGFVFQNFNLIQPLTAEENVMIPLQLQGIPVAAARKRAQEAIEEGGYE